MNSTATGRPKSMWARISGSARIAAGSRASPATAIVFFPASSARAWASTTGSLSR